jgi:hypothetical protein
MTHQEKEQLFNVLMGMAHEIDQLQQIPLGAVKIQVALNAKFLLEQEDVKRVINNEPVERM